MSSFETTHRFFDDNLVRRSVNENVLQSVLVPLRGGLDHDKQHYFSQLGICECVALTFDGQLKGSGDFLQPDVQSPGKYTAALIAICRDIQADRLPESDYSKALQQVLDGHFDKGEFSSYLEQPNPSGE